jgi:putative transposase
MKELDAFIESNREPRELKRGLAVRMTLNGYKHREIIKILQVSSGFISKWKQEYILNGIEGLKLKHQGSRGYLSQSEKQEVLLWLEKKKDWNLNELEYYIASEFEVTFAARSSYYELFHAAGRSWKKSQKRNSAKDPEAVAEKKKRLSNF